MAPEPIHYLDNAATTALRPEAMEALLPVLTDHYGNPSGAHRLARRANQVVDEARESLAASLGCEPGQLVFTGGGTEADNLAISGAVEATGGVAVCSAIEHHAVLDPVLHHGAGHGGGSAGSDGGDVVIPVGLDGRLDLDALSDILSAHADAGRTVAVVSLMMANNETGIVQPLAETVDVVRSLAPDALVHTDAVQALCWLDVAQRSADGVDLVSISGHKFGGPKGVGALVVRDRARLVPLLKGGGQERGRRGGTHNVAGIAALAAAAAATVAERPTAVPRVAALRDRLVDGIKAKLDGVIESGIDAAPGATGTLGPADRSAKTANIAHLCFDGIASEALLFLLERDGVMASAASSCSSGAMEPSHVLAAMGFPRDLAFGSLRLSLGYGTTDDDVDAALSSVVASVDRLRERG